MLIKNIYFWVITVILLTVVSFSGLKIIPPIIASYQENQLKMTEQTAELEKQKKFLSAVNAVKNNPESLDELYTQALLALPKSTDSEILMLQLDGLLTSLGLSTTSINVPLQSGEDETQNSLDVNVSGDITYDQLIILLPKLKTFSRWNKISTFDIKKDTEKYTTSITIKAFFKPGGTGEFSGNSNILNQAEELFTDFMSYATIPDINTEGTFGRPNPFTP